MNGAASVPLTRFTFFVVLSTKDYVITLLEDPVKSDDSSRVKTQPQLESSKMLPEECTAGAAPSPLHDLISMKKIELQRMLKERGEPISGNKSTLIEKLLPLLEEDLVEYSPRGRNGDEDDEGFHDEEEDGDEEDEDGGLLLSSCVEFEKGVRLRRALEKFSGKLGSMIGGMGTPCRSDEATHSGSSSSNSRAGGDHMVVAVPQEAESELVNLITLYLRARPTHETDGTTTTQSPGQGHYSGSRNIGRYLQKVKVDPKLFGNVSSALEYLKTHYGTLTNFIAQHPNEFKTTLTDHSADGLRQYIVALAHNHD